MYRPAHPLHGGAATRLANGRLAVPAADLLSRNRGSPYPAPRCGSMRPWQSYLLSGWSGAPGAYDRMLGAEQRSRTLLAGSRRDDEEIGPISDFLRDLVAGDCSPLTVRSYANDLLRWFRFVFLWDCRADCEGTPFRGPRSGGHIRWTTSRGPGHDGGSKSCTEGAAADLSCLLRRCHPRRISFRGGMSGAHSPGSHTPSSARPLNGVR